MRISYKEMDTKNSSRTGAKSVKILTRILLNSSQLEIENRKPMLRYYVGMGNKNNV